VKEGHATIERAAHVHWARCGRGRLDSTSRRVARAGNLLPPLWTKLLKPVIASLRIY